MTAIDAREIRSEGSALFTLGFRPFFLAGSIWSALALALWVAMLMGHFALPSRFDPMTWHIHEMMFGFVFAAVAGFLLTAVANWTGRAPIQGTALIGLFLLWVAGRIAGMVSGLLPLWLAIAADVAFPVILSAALAREVLAVRNWRNLPIALAVLLLGIADLLMWLELTPLEVPPGLGGRLGLALIVILMTVVAGRIVPAFTRNWLRRRGLEPSQAVGPGAIDSAARGLLLAGFLGFAFFPASQVVGVLLLAAAGFNLVRLARWGGWKTVAEPLLFILHVGYFWIVAGSALLGASLLTDAVPQPAAIHALTAGAIGTMILAVMTRVSLGHTGRPLEADFATTLIYALVTIAAVARICAAIHGGWAFLLDLSGAFWVASFALFALRYGPILIAPRPDGRAP